MARWVAAGKVVITRAVLFQKIIAPDFKNAEAIAENWRAENDLKLLGLVRVYDDSLLYLISDKPISGPVAIR